MNITIDPTSSVFVTGSLESQARARVEYRKQQRLRIAHTAGKPELPRKNLRFDPHYVVHEPDGSLYRIYRGEVMDAQYADFDAFYVDQAGDAVFLQHPPGPRTLDELDQARAEREQLRAERQAAPVRIRGRT